MYNFRNPLIPGRNNFNQRSRNNNWNRNSRNTCPPPCSNTSSSCNPCCDDQRCNPNPCCDDQRCNPNPCCDDQRCDPNPCCDDHRCDPNPCCNQHVCQPCYNEEDYKVDVIHQLFEDYNQIEKKADAHFNNALTNLCDAIEEIENGLKCNKEGLAVWVEMECWLKRYYERFGKYCGCMEKMQEFREFVKKMLILEWGSLETAKLAHSQLEESRCLDKELHGLKCEIHDRCLPRC